MTNEIVYHKQWFGHMLLRLTFNGSNCIEHVTVSGELPETVRLTSFPCFSSRLIISKYPFEHAAIRGDLLEFVI